MTKPIRIAISGKMHIGKNFFSSILLNILKKECNVELKEISIAKSLKENSIRPQGFDGDTFNYNYLQEDIEQAIRDKTLNSLLEESGATETALYKAYNNNTLDTFDVKDLTSEELLLILDALKRHPEKYQTRKSLQKFGDHLKNISKNNFYLSELLLDGLDNNTSYICTDERFFTEHIDFALNDFIFIALENEDIKDDAPWFQHTSELEMSVNNKSAIVIDLRSKDGLEVAGLKRKSKEEIEDIIYTQVLPFVKNFSGYDKEALDDIRKIKEELNTVNDGLFKVRADYLAMQGSVLRGEAPTKDLIEAYNSYIKLSEEEKERLHKALHKYYN